MSVFTLAARNGLNGQTLHKQYKERISDCRGWNQLGHAGEYILYPENPGSDMSLDETCLSNGNVYTVLTNKGAHGGKGALSAMMLTVRTVFPGASLINDRFHVQQLLSEAVDQLRIRHRWEVLDAENKPIREHCARRKGAPTREERGRIGQWEPERMDNGEKLPQIMARSRHIILKHKSKWNGQQAER